MKHPVDWYNFYNKNCLFDAKFFEFEDESYSSFFLVASSLSTLCISTSVQWLFLVSSISMYDLEISIKIQ